GDLPALQCRELICKTRALTDRPFAVNIFVHQIPELTEALKVKYTRARIFIEELARQHMLPLNLPHIEELVFTDYREQVNLLIAEQCPVVSFTFGNLDT